MVDVFMLNIRLTLECTKTKQIGDRSTLNFVGCEKKLRFKFQPDWMRQNGCDARLKVAKFEN